tara:strand:+ start:2112 stop:2351 length:240 start_codon:yes stop_codon:yes gene_type:complete
MWTAGLSSFAYKHEIKNPPHTCQGTRSVISETVGFVFSASSNNMYYVATQQVKKHPFTLKKISDVEEEEHAKGWYVRNK